MSKIRLTPNASGTGTVTLTVPSTSTDRTVTLPDETGTVITTTSTVAPKVPAFRAVQLDAVDQAINTTTHTKINFATEEFDTAGFYDPSTSRFQPTIAGYYHICSSVRASGVSNNCRFDTAYYIDGSISTYGMGLSNGDTRDMQTFAAVLMYLDGTQYVEVYVEQNSGINNNVLATNNASATEGGITYFTGYLVHAT